MDVESAAACVLGGKVTPMLRELGPSLRMNQVSMQVQGLKTLESREMATIEVGNFIVRQSPRGAPPTDRLASKI
jgi:hypothetical protein